LVIWVTVIQLVGLLQHARAYSGFTHTLGLGSQTPLCRFPHVVPFVYLLPTFPVRFPTRLHHTPRSRYGSPTGWFLPTLHYTAHGWSHTTQLVPTFGCYVWLLTVVHDCSHARLDHIWTVPTVVAHSYTHRAVCTHIPPHTPPPHNPHTFWIVDGLDYRLFPDCSHSPVVITVGTGCTRTLPHVAVIAHTLFTPPRLGYPRSHTHPITLQVIPPPPPQLSPHCHHHHHHTLPATHPHHTHTRTHAHTAATPHCTHCSWTTRLDYPLTLTLVGR